MVHASGECHAVSCSPAIHAALSLIAPNRSPWQKMPRVELVIAVLITPFLCNVFAFWVTDSFLKGKLHNHETCVVCTYVGVADTATVTLLGLA